MQQENKINLIIRTIPTGFYNGLIWFMSSIPIAINISGFDKTVHIIEYSVLGFLLAFNWKIIKNNFEEKGKYCLFTGAIIGAMDEVHQHFTPGRSMDFVDFCADITGISLGILLWLLLIRVLTFVKTFFVRKTQS